MKRVDKEVIFSLLRLICTYLLVFLPTVYWYVYNSVPSVTQLIINGLLIIPVVLLIFIIPSRKLNLIAISILFVIAILELVDIIENGNYVNTLELSSVLHPSNSESSDLLLYGTKYVLPHFWLEMFIYIIALLLSIYTWTYSELWKKIIACIVPVIIFFYCVFFSAMRYCSPYRFSVEVYYMLRMDCKKLLTKREHAVFSYSPSTNKKEGIYVLAIGESMRYNNISINGYYPRETTPHLKYMVDNNLCSYTNCYSSALFTQLSVPLLLTRATANNFDLNFAEKPITSAFKESGFRTIIISSSEQVMNSSKYSYLTTGADSVIWVKSDESIPRVLSSIVRDNTNYFFILHFLGSHFFYGNYTQPFNKWTPNYTYNKDCQSDSLFINAYDNSILYSDSLLSACIDVLNLTNNPVSLLYTSDHGEYIDAHVGGHGFSYHPTKDEYHVPLMVWYSDEYAEAYPDKVVNMKKHKDEPVCADHVFWSVLDMAGIRIDSTLQQDGMSIFGDTLLPHTRTLLLPDGKSVMELD